MAPKHSFNGMVAAVTQNAAVLKFFGLEKEIEVTLGNYVPEKGQRVIAKRTRMRTRNPSYEYDVYAMQRDGMQQKYVGSVSEDIIKGALKW